MTQRIYILTSERSGSNLLRRLLGKHPAICAPVPAHLFDSFYAVSEKLGDLSLREKRLHLLFAMRKLCNHRFSDWRLEMGVEEIDRRFEPTNFISMVDAIYRAKTEESGKSSYICKENFLARYADAIDQELRNVNWVHLVRDPRDVVASWRKHRMRYHSAYDAAAQWKRDQREIQKFKQRTEESVHEVTYECLVSNTAREITAILKWLRLEIVEKCFSNDEQAVEAERSRLWSSLQYPVSDRWIGAWRDILNRRELRIIETVCSNEMHELGYRRILADAPFIEVSRLTSLLRRLTAKIQSSMPIKDGTRNLVQSRERLKVSLIRDLLKG